MGYSYHIFYLVLLFVGFFFFSYGEGFEGNVVPNKVSANLKYIYGI